MVLRVIFLVFAVFYLREGVYAQSNACTFKPPFYTMHFGRGAVPDVNTASLAYYNRVASSCPSDGYYAYVSSMTNCFRGDWHTLTEDHTPGDVGGNMLVVNSAYSEGVFLTTRVKGFKGGTTYQFGVWLMNVCRPTDKCPFPLLPNLLIRLQTPRGKTVAQISTGEITRVVAPHWTQHRARFAVPANESELIVTFLNRAPGGCGNDFALDDMTFQECVPPEPARLVEAKKQPAVTAKGKTPPTKKETPKTVTALSPPVRKNPVVSVTNSKGTVPDPGRQVSGTPPASVGLVPLVIRQRSNPLAGRIVTEAGEILLQLYDNGEIDGDTVSIYHNNKLIVSAQRLSQKPITFRIQVDETQPHHELVMVANNLGSIPPNTSVMMITTKEKRHQVFISSSEQKNARVVIELRKD